MIFCGESLFSADYAVPLGACERSRILLSHSSVSLKVFFVSEFTMLLSAV